MRSAVLILCSLNCACSLSLQARHAARQRVTISMGPKKGGKRPGGVKSSGGFGAKKAPAPERATAAADKASLERQWDRFVAITDLDILPRGDDTWEVADVFVRNGMASRVRWWRIGKVAADGGVDMQAALRLQKGLILWTSVHMRRELMAAGGLASAASLELGFSRASMSMAALEDGAVGEDELEVEPVLNVPVKSVPLASMGFRPDYNPPGFAYKRREKAGGLKEKERKMKATAGIVDEIFDELSGIDSGEWDPLGLESEGAS